MQLTNPLIFLSKALEGNFAQHQVDLDSELGLLKAYQVLSIMSL